MQCWKTSFLGVMLAVAPLLSFRLEAQTFYEIGQSTEQHKKVMVAAHRGANAFAPENTLAAFRKAIALKVDFIEFDVRTTIDGHLIIMHDADIARTTNGRGKVNEISFKEIKSLSAGAWFNASFADEKIPSLRDLCEAILLHYDSGGYQVGLYVDCKDANPQQLVDSIREFELLDDCVFYGSDEYLMELKKYAPGVRIMPSLRKASDATEKINMFSPYAFDVSWTALNENLIRQLRKKGIKVFTDAPHQELSEEEYHQVMRMGVDLIQTDHIGALKRAIESFYGQ
ncbi:MAG: glycerophosphodiester phosphodiesterase family protein [Cyclobacteriaceae bacterium]|nr:glycerophosphodiester phosphodiesterase family protein [Cyclobacteriaceae bacterium]